MNSILFSICDTQITAGSLIEFLIILALTYLLAKLIKYHIRRFGKRHRMVSNSGIYALSRLGFYVVGGLGLIAAFSAIGVDLSTFTVLVGALSVGIGFGLQAIFNNFISGIILLLEKNIHVGDEIELDSGQKGIVEEIFVRTTLIRGAEGQTLIIPNTDLVSRRISNWTTH